MPKYTGHLLVFAVLCVLGASGADAATSKFTSLPVDDLAVKFFDSLVNVWIPIVALTALIGLVINMFVGIMQIGAKVVGFVFGMSILAGGMPLLNSIFGSKLVTALLLP